jgi:hypothetical protein
MHAKWSKIGLNEKGKMDSDAEEQGESNGAIHFGSNGISGVEK